MMPAVLATAIIPYSQGITPNIYVMKEYEPQA